MPIVVYKCKHCKNAFDNRQAAVDCENSHLKIKSAKVKQYMLNSSYPLFVEIEFKNGEKEVYMLEKEVWNK